MKTCSKCGKTKPKDEFASRAASLDGLRSQCKACRRAGARIVYGAARHEKRAAKAAWRVANPEKIKAIYATYYYANREKEKDRRAARTATTCTAEESAKRAAWRANNLDKDAATRVAWQKANADRTCAYAAARRARKLQATPAWTDDAFVALWYKGASIMTQLTGAPYHVDHIVPLKSKLVCGLHAHTNMQILPGADNLKKGNRYWPDMPQRRA